MVVDMGEKTAPSDADRTMAFFWGMVKTEYATSGTTGCSLKGSALGSIPDACPDAGT